MDILDFIYSLDVSNGETKRVKCPSCGNSKYEKTFTVTNNMGSILWNCYKASCSLSGSARNNLTVSDIKRLQMGESTEAKWGIDENKLNLLYDVKDDRVVFPVIHNGIMVDATGRSLGKRFPKWNRYGKSSLPYVCGSGTVAVVVEDCVSAAVVGDYGSFVGVAILGTSLQDSHKKYLSQFSTAIVALDPDALPKTLQFASELRGYVNDVKVLRLEDDIKYKRQQDIDKLMSFKTDKGE